MFVPSRHRNLTVCTFVACFRSASTLTGSRVVVKELSTFGIENLAHHSKNEVEQLVTASAHAIPDSSEAREGKTVSTDQLEALRKQSASIAKSNGEHLSRGSTQPASSYPEALGEVQRGSRTNGTLVSLLQGTSLSREGEIGGVLPGSTTKSHVIRVPNTEMQKLALPRSSKMLLKDRKLQTTRQEIDPDRTVTAASELQQTEEKVSKGESDGVLLGNTIKSHVIRVPKNEVQKPVLPKSSERLLKDRTPETTRQEIDPDGTVKAVPELQQSKEKTDKLHSITQILPNGQSRTFVRTERKRTSQVGRLELGGAENDKGVSLQAPQTPAAVQQAPVQASAPAVAATGPPAVSTSSPPASQQDSTFLGSLGSLLFWIVFIAVVALGSFWLGQRSAHRASSNEASLQQASSRPDGFSTKYGARLSIRSRASSRGRGSDDDDASSASEVCPSPRPRSLQRHGVPLLQRHSVARDSLAASSNKLQSFDVGDRVKVLKQSRLRGKTATVIDPCWRIVSGERMVQVRMDCKDEKGEVKSFKEADLELIHIFQVGDKVKVMKETRLKGKTAVVIDPCWRKANGFTLIQVKMDETDEKGEIKSFTQGDLAPARGGD